MLLRRPDDLADLFREGRRRAGWSQRVLAQEAGVSRQWVSLVETGKTTVEFDLVVEALQALGYRIHVESAADTRRPHDVELPSHGPTRRTPLTRDGEPLVPRTTRVRGGGRS